MNNDYNNDDYQNNKDVSIYDDNFVESYMEKSKTKSDNTKKIIIIFVVVLAVIAIGLGIFIFIKNITGNNQSNNNEKPLEENLSLNNEIVKNLYDMINKVQQRGICSGSIYYFENDEITINKYNNEKKYEQAFVLINKDDIEVIEDNGLNAYIISNKTMDDAMKKFFGPKVTYTKTGDHVIVPIELTNDSSIHLLFIYDNEKEHYIGSLLKGNNSNCEPKISSNEYFLNTIYTKLISATKKDDYIILTQKFIITDNINKIYNDPKKENLISTISPKTKEEDVKSFNISQFLSKAKTVTYTFKIADDNNYYFYSSKLSD